MARTIIPLTNDFLRRPGLPGRPFAIGLVVAGLWQGAAHAQGQAAAQAAAQAAKPAAVPASPPASATSGADAAPQVTPGGFDAKAVTEAGNAAPRPGSIQAPASLPHGLPSYFGPVYDSVLRAPLPRTVARQAGIPPVVPEYELDADATGRVASTQPGGPTDTKANAFFMPLGSNGRTCATCHLPPDAMSVSVGNIVSRWIASNGKDPIFAPVDGANCPSLVQPGATSGGLLGGITGQGKSDFEAAHSLLLTRGLFRIFLPVPANADYTVSVVRDPDGPNGCNTNTQYTSGTDPVTGSKIPLLSMFRRPRISGSLAYVLTTGFASGVNPPVARDPIDGQPVTRQVVETNPGTGKKFVTQIGIDPATGRPISGNIMWDGREATLETQAVDATLGHAQAAVPPTETQTAQMVQFERGIYSAQAWDAWAHRLNEFGGLGGPEFLSAGAPGDLPAPGAAAFALFGLWNTLPPGTDRAAERADVAAGEALFSSNPFTISNVAGFNNIAVLGNNRKGTCSSCHNQVSAGNDAFVAAQHDIGIGATQPAAGPGTGVPPLSNDLPIFEFVCKPGSSTAFYGTDVKTNDPGLALTTGKCADIGRFTVPQLRGLAARAPYFSDGSAATLLDVVNFYNTRFAMALTETQKRQLVAFLRSL